MYYSEIVVIKLNNKKYVALLISSIVIVVVATISITYAYLSFSDTQEGTNTLSTSCYNISFTDQNSINITSYPMSSASAFRNITPYTFTISNNDCEIGSGYQIILNVLSSSSDKLLPYINFSLDGETSTRLTSLTATTLPAGVSSSNVKASYVIETGILPNIDSSKTYNLHLWIDESAGKDIMGEPFQAEIIVYSSMDLDIPDIPDTPDEPVEPEPPKPTIKDEILANSTRGSGTPTFNKTSCSSGCGEKTVGLYEGTRNNGTVYYFRGDIANNYVNFGGFTWRILMIDENGNIRMILDDLIRNNGNIVTKQFKTTNSSSSSSASITLVSYINDVNDSSQNSPLYGSISSTDPTNLRGWYNTYLTDYEEYIETSSFCIDTSGASYSSSVYYYGPYRRIGADTRIYNPSFDCTGGTIIDEKVGLLSSDEYVFAGGAFRAANTSFFLYTGDNTRWWTLSPAYYDSSQRKSSSFAVLADGSITDYIDGNTITNTGGIRPVITISGDTPIEGDGSSSAPYQIAT